MKPDGSAHRECTTYFFSRYLDVEKVNPRWGGKEGELLKEDLARFNGDGKYLRRLIDVFFTHPPEFAAKVGLGYNIFHSQIDTLIRAVNGRVQEAAKKVPCPVCGAACKREFGYWVCPEHGRREELG